MAKIGYPEGHVTRDRGDVYVYICMYDMYIYIYTYIYIFTHNTLGSEKGLQVISRA